MPAPSSESYFDWNDPGHRMPGVVRKCLLFAAYTDPDVKQLAWGIINSSVAAMHGEISEVESGVAQKYLMPEELVAAAIQDRVRFHQSRLKVEGWSNGEA